MNPHNHQHRRDGAAARADVEAAVGACWAGPQALSDSPREAYAERGCGRF